MATSKRFQTLQQLQQEEGTVFQVVGDLSKLPKWFHTEYLRGPKALHLDAWLVEAIFGQDGEHIPHVECVTHTLLHVNQWDPEGEAEILIFGPPYYQQDVSSMILRLADHCHKHLPLSTGCVGRSLAPAANRGHSTPVARCAVTGRTPHPAVLPEPAQETQCSPVEVSEAATQPAPVEVFEAATQHIPVEVREASTQHSLMEVQEASTQHSPLEILEASTQQAPVEVHEAATQQPQVEVSEASTQQASKRVGEVSTQKTPMKVGEPSTQQVPEKVGKASIQQVPVEATSQKFLEVVLEAGTQNSPVKVYETGTQESLDMVQNARTQPPGPAWEPVTRL
ncbi:KHDC3-like protein [Nannospalax galili]|uniref:KHDC3-like protein n=1 Tax=Nannospalax galili TaxID=1026970 RepID=UPI00111BE507|nr:KHDC3-like protein [Nannospalax galili]